MHEEGNGGKERALSASLEFRGESIKRKKGREGRKVKRKNSISSVIHLEGWIGKH